MPDKRAGFGNAYGWSRLVFDLAALTFVGIIRTANNRNDVKIGNWSVFQGETSAEAQRSICLVIIDRISATARRWKPWRGGLSAPNKALPN